MDCYFYLEDTHVTFFIVSLNFLFTNIFVTAYAAAKNDLWSFNISSGNWTWRGGSNSSDSLPLANYPDQIGGIGWPGGTMQAMSARISTSIFIFGGTGTFECYYFLFHHLMFFF